MHGLGLKSKESIGGRIYGSLSLSLLIIFVK